MSKSLMHDGLYCNEHSLFMCNKCLVNEVARLEGDLAEHRAVLAAVGNIIGGPVAAISEELRSEERAERIERAGELIARTLSGPGGDLRERLADLCHAQWSGWMVYLFGKCLRARGDDSTVIPTSLVERWMRQMNTPYEHLSDAEKDSDRKEADKFIALLGGGVRV